MLKVFSKSKWIWENAAPQADEYGEFVFALPHDARGGETELYIAADSDYNVLVNGETIAFGQYLAYPHYTVYDRIDLTPHLKEKNEIRIIVWYYGENSQTYLKSDAGLIFEVRQAERILAYSGEHIQSRICKAYENHRRKIISAQLGFSWKYCANESSDNPFSDSVLVKKSMQLFLRPNEKTVLGERAPMELTDYGDSVLIDMQTERVGFLELDIESETEQEIKIGYGEYLFNGQVRHVIGGMEYSVEYVTKKGRNVYNSRFRRLAGRYLQVFFKNPIKIRYVGLREVFYPLTVKEFSFRSPIRNRIYAASLRTLRACMHDHFEDCPWREQALYVLDSRNEMLCAYAAFDDYKFCRADILLISKGLRADGLLALCYPTGIDAPIPFYSLTYPLQVSEYVRHSGDTSILKEVFPVVERIVELFVARVEKNGLIAQFPYPYWNFVEWSIGSEDREHLDRNDPNEKLNRYDLTLNCMFLLAVERYKELCGILGKVFEYDATRTKDGIRKNFFDEERGLFKGRVGDDEKPFYSVLGNSLALLCGLGDETLADRILSDETIVPITLCMNTFLYEALLKINGQKYKSFIIEDIDKKYSNMLSKGATTFWETEGGAAAFGDTGSLCHGWSAMPIYYYRLLNGKEYFDGEL